MRIRFFKVGLMFLFGMGVVEELSASELSNRATKSKAGGAYQIRHAHLGSGSTRSTSSGSGNYQMTATIAQPAVGYSASNSYQLDAGFWRADRPIHIFSNGFE